MKNNGNKQEKSALSCELNLMLCIVQANSNIATSKNPLKTARARLQERKTHCFWSQKMFRPPKETNPNFQPQTIHGCFFKGYNRITHPIHLPHTTPARHVLRIFPSNDSLPTWTPKPRQYRRFVGIRLHPWHRPGIGWVRKASHTKVRCFEAKSSQNEGG